MLCFGHLCVCVPVVFVSSGFSEEGVLDSEVFESF
jgi:hypothetical protein